MGLRGALHRVADRVRDRVDTIRERRAEHHMSRSYGQTLNYAPPSRQTYVAPPQRPQPVFHQPQTYYPPALPYPAPGYAGQVWQDAPKPQQSAQLPIPWTQFGQTQGHTPDPWSQFGQTQGHSPNPWSQFGQVPAQTPAPRTQFGQVPAQTPAPRTQFGQMPGQTPTPWTQVGQTAAHTGPQRPTTRTTAQHVNTPLPGVGIVLNDTEAADCARLMHPLLLWANPTEKIVAPLQSRGNISASSKAKVFLKLFEILRTSAVPEKFSHVFREKLSCYIEVFATEFPFLNVDDYFLNLGPDPLSQAPSDLVQIVGAEKIQEAKYSITLKETAIKHVLRTNMPLPELPVAQRVAISNIEYLKLENLENRLHNLPQNQMSTFIVEHGRGHLTLVLARSFPMQTDFLVIETMGENTGQLRVVIESISKACAYKQGTKISYFRLRRQHDFTHCPVFILNDLYMCFQANMFDYINYVETNYPSKIQYQSPYGGNVRIQGVPTYPGHLLMTQSVQFFASILPISQERGMNYDTYSTEQFDPDFTFRIVNRDSFERSLRESIMHVTMPPKPPKYMNMAVEMCLMRYLDILVRHLLSSQIVN